MIASSNPASNPPAIPDSLFNVPPGKKQQERHSKTQRDNDCDSSSSSSSSEDFDELEQALQQFVFAQEKRKIRFTPVRGAVYPFDYFKKGSSSSGVAAAAGISAKDKTKEKPISEYLLDCTLQGISTDALRQGINSKADDYFLPNSQERVALYEEAAAKAIRKGDLDELKRLLINQHQQGSSNNSSTQPVDWNGCNARGESLLHLACRLNHRRIISFLLEQAKVSCRVRDKDCGKSPFHELCWNPSPDFDAVKALILKAPELLFYRDVRGFMALDYVPHRARPAWCVFFDAKAPLIRHAVQFAVYAQSCHVLHANQERLHALLQDRMIHLTV